MEYDNGERHLKEIDHVSILESIDEMFDGATSLLTQNAVMYGSTITALLTGLPVVGDLDVAVSNQEYMTLCRAFANSVKWLQIEGKNIPESQPTQRMGKYQVTSVAHSTPPSSPYAKSDNPYTKDKHLPISKVVAFHTVNGARVQIMESKAMTGDMLEDAINVVRKVDFAFCGMAVDKWGRVLEVIPHAYSDCLGRFIRIHNYQHRSDATRLRQRILKYVKRGWSLTFSIDQAMINLRRAKHEYAMRPKKKKKFTKSKSVSGFLFKKDTKRGVLVEVKRNFQRMVGSSTPIRDAMRHFAHNDFGIKLNSTTNKHGRMEFWCTKSGKLMTLAYAKKLVLIVDKYLSDRHKIDHSKLQLDEKKDQMSSMYGSNTYTKGFVSDRPSTLTNKYGYSTGASKYKTS